MYTKILKKHISSFLCALVFSSAVATSPVSALDDRIIYDPAFTQDTFFHAMVNFINAAPTSQPTRPFTLILQDDTAKYLTKLFLDHLARLYQTRVDPLLQQLTVPRETGPAHIFHSRNRQMIQYRAAATSGLIIFPNTGPAAANAFAYEESFAETSAQFIMGLMFSPIPLNGQIQYNYNLGFFQGSTFHHLISYATGMPSNWITLHYSSLDHLPAYLNASANISGQLETLEANLAPPRGSRTKPARRNQPEEAQAQTPSDHPIPTVLTSNTAQGTTPVSTGATTATPSSTSTGATTARAEETTATPSSTSTGATTARAEETTARAEETTARAEETTVRHRRQAIEVPHTNTDEYEVALPAGGWHQWLTAQLPSISRTIITFLGGALGGATTAYLYLQITQSQDQSK